MGAQRSHFGKKKAAKSIRCTNFAASLHLQKLWLRESFWSIESNRYKDRDKKKTEYGKILNLLKDEVPGIDFSSLEGDR